MESAEVVWRTMEPDEGVLSIEGFLPDGMIEDFLPVDSLLGICSMSIAATRDAPSLCELQYSRIGLFKTILASVTQLRK